MFVPAACKTAQATKFVPRTSSSPLFAPNCCVICALLTVGIGLRIASLAVAVRVGAATLMALTVTALGLGIAAGGVDTPVVEIIPTVELPPVTPLICQVTAVLDSSVTVAVN